MKKTLLFSSLVFAFQSMALTSLTSTDISGNGLTLSPSNTEPVSGNISTKTKNTQNPFPTPTPPTSGDRSGGSNNGSNTSTFLSGGSFGNCDNLRIGTSRIIDGAVQFCNGSEWKGIFAESTGKLCTTQQKGLYSLYGDSLEFCNGANWLTTGNKILESCQNIQKGKFRFDVDPTGASTGKVMQFCNGANWLDLSTKVSSPIAGCSKPSIGTPGSDFSPVCSTDAEWFADKYLLACAGKTKSYDLFPTNGRCESSSPSLDCTAQVTYACGSDGITYASSGCNSYPFPVGVTYVKSVPGPLMCPEDGT